MRVCSLEKEVGLNAGALGVMFPSCTRFHVPSTPCKLVEVMQEIMAQMMVLGGKDLMFLGGKDKRKSLDKGRGCILWLVCSRGVIEEVLRLVCSRGNFKEVLRDQVFYMMEASLESTGSSPPVIFVDSDIWDLKK